MPDTPEQKARRLIDANLGAAGWLVQDLDDLDIGAGPGVAVREFPMKPGFGFADYLLYVDRKAVGAVEAKAAGTLTGVEAQSAKYAAGLPNNLPARRRPLPFLFESNGAVTYATNGLDPAPRSRQVFNFPRPETLADLAGRVAQFRTLLQRLPDVDASRLWTVQAAAIRNLDRSLGRGDPRALVQMATGSGKTFTAVNVAYRLLKFGGARRVLFLVDRGNLGKQTEDEFNDFTPPDDHRKFRDLYTVQRLKSNAINPAAEVVITTIQRLYSMLKGDAEFDPGNEERSAFDAPPLRRAPPDVTYRAAIPPEFFDVVIVDECHRSIYELWSQVLLYFDAFLVGLTATPSGRTIGFFNQNLVMQYGHDEAVADGVNVDFDVYRVRTRVTEQGATIAAEPDTAVYVDRRDKLTRAERLELLAEDLTYTAGQLDRDVVSESQIRTVLYQLRDRVFPEAFPKRGGEAPKTLIFAKDDSHADDVVRIAREVFGRGNDFCEKITYRTGFTKVVHRAQNADGTEAETYTWEKTSSLTPDEILANFRNKYNPRVAVTVDMIATGTDVKSIECLVFLRNVKSAGFFDQMKGRGVRVIPPDKLRLVTPAARVKDRFIIVDAVGVFERDRTDARTLNRRHSEPLDSLLTYVSQGGTDDDVLTTLAGRLARLQHQFTPAQLDELAALAGGRTLAELSRALLRACDPDAQREAALAAGAGDPPNAEELQAAAGRLADAAVAPFYKPAFRRRMLELRQQREQTIDRHTVDEVLYAGFDAAAVEKARRRVRDFRAWMAEHRDELTALQMLYAGVRPLRLTLGDLRQLKEALARPPLGATPLQLWRAFEGADASEGRRVREPAADGARTGGEQLADLVQLVRHAVAPEAAPLVPYAALVRERYERWRAEQARAGAAFTAEQAEWLDRMAEHVATSMRIERGDFEAGWFGQRGSLGRAHRLFGDRLGGLMAELNEKVAA